MKGSSFRSYEYHAKTTITKSEMLPYAKKKVPISNKQTPQNHIWDWGVLVAETWLTLFETFWTHHE
jgi:hypothetical protein